MIESFEIAMSEPRKGWPTLPDLEQGNVLINSAYITKVENLLKTQRRCLIRGAEGRGKTVLARVFADKKHKQGWKVRFLEMPQVKEGDFARVLKQIDQAIAGDDNKTLLLIENAHYSDEMTSQLINYAETSKGFFIFTSRKIFESEKEERKKSIDLEDPFEVWVENGWYLDVSPDLQAVRDIIQKFAEKRKVSYSLSQEDELWIIEEFGSAMPNLRRLDFYLEAWDSKVHAPLSSIKKEDILRSIYKNYIEPLKDPDLQDMLIKVAAVFQFDVNFSGTNFDKKLLNGLCDNGVITFLPGYFYRLQHSTDAAYIVEAEASLKASETSDDFTIKKLKDYLQEKPENYHELLRAVRRNDKKNILSAIFDDDEIYKIILSMVKQDSIKALSSVIDCLTWSYGKKKSLEFWEQYKKSYGSPEEQKKYIQNKLHRANLWEIRLLLSFIKKLDVRENGWLLEGLDFKALGGRSKDTGLANARTFLELARQAGVGSDKLNAFCEGLDFKALGERSKDKGLAGVRTFLQLTRQAGVGSDKLNAFCEGLDFKALGERSKDTGLANVTTFLQLASQAGVEKDKLNAFCRGINFKSLGERSKDKGRAGVMNFLRLTRQVGVSDSILKSFCESLDWEVLGKSLGGKITDVKSPFFEFHSVTSYSFISREMATLFIEGIGWETMRKGISDRFSPDILATLVELLFNKCGLTPDELLEKGLVWDHEKIWFNSFINHPCPKSKPEQQFIQNKYLRYAGECFIKYAAEYFNRNSPEMSLKSWNIFIHNISGACPEYLEKQVIPLFKGFSVKKIEELFCESDIKNIGLFLNRFNPKDGDFKWALSDEVDFKKINFIEKIVGSDLTAISHFLFNFYFINRGDCSNHFAKQLDDARSCLIPTITDASIEGLDFFFWNFWMAMPKGQTPQMFNDEKIIKVITEKVTREQKNNQDEEHLLGLLGTIYLSTSEIPKGLSELLSAQKAKSLCEKSIKEGSIKQVRLLGGSLLLLPKSDLMELNKAVEHYKFSMSVPNQMEALRFIEKELSL